VLHLTVTSSAPRPLLFGYLEDVSPEGTAKVVAFGRLAAAYRKEAAAPYDVMGLPWHSGLESDQAPLLGDRPVSLRFALTPAARRIPAGHRLRLVVTGADPRQRNLQEVRIDPAPTITIRTGRGSTSRLELPLRAVRE
jgi:predicted acyl esterase